MNVDLVPVIAAAVAILRLPAAGTRDEEVEGLLVLLLSNLLKQDPAELPALEAAELPVAHAGQDDVPVTRVTPLSSQLDNLRLTGITAPPTTRTSASAWQ